MLWKSRKRVHPSCILLPPELRPDFDTLLEIVETRWCSATSTPTIPPDSPQQEIAGQRPEGRLSTGRSTVHNSLLWTKIFFLFQGQPSSPDITFLGGHLLPGKTWSTLNTLESDHLPFQSRPALTAESAFFYELPQSWLGGIYSRDRKEILPIHLYQPPALIGKKSSGASSATPEDTSFPVIMLETFAAPSRMLCDPSSRRETSAALMTLSTLPSSCWTGTSSSTSSRKRRTSGGPCWNPPTALPTPIKRY